MYGSGATDSTCFVFWASGSALCPWFPIDVPPTRAALVCYSQAVIGKLACETTAVVTISAFIYALCPYIRCGIPFAASTISMTLFSVCLFKGSWNLSKRSRPSFRFDSRWLQEDEPLLLEGDGAKYVVVFDPLDGSSNIDASIPTGACLRRGGGVAALLHLTARWSSQGPNNATKIVFRFQLSSSSISRFPSDQAQFLGCI